jgi:hypothetical protein
MDGINFTQLIILLLPGFWSLWIYSPFTGYDFKALEWQEKIMMALGFGVFNLIALSGFNLVCEIGTIEKQFLSVGILSIISGFLGGLLAQKEWLPTLIWHKIVAKHKNGPAATPYEKALDYYDAHRKDICEGDCAIMKVYPVGEENKALIGEYQWGYGKTGEVLLTWTSLLKGIDLTQFCRSIIINDPASNRVFEIYPLSKEEMQNLLDERMSVFFSA